ncbi:hypothetical protein BS47DRAFT_1363546 [Hydnum rufescens UP504]|uniref:Uncharacterized protein n=1 Tax=Hydnum rufescens UP504 TaxID=1448309 RepID=A0A9P6AW45_9AGAM|nr:hypothetical protein BS47DRAFT_1363546 [Hydnum rufescens UP504]
MDPAPIPQHISTKLSNAELIQIACDLQDHNNKMQAMIEKTCMHAAIIGQQYTQLQNQVNAKTNAPETSCQSFSGMAHVLNTTEALATIAAERAEEVSKAQEKEQESGTKQKRQKRLML